MEKCNIKACQRPVLVEDTIPSAEEMQIGKRVLIVWNAERGKFIRMKQATILGIIDADIWLVKPESHHAIRVLSSEIITCPDHMCNNSEVDEDLPNRNMVSCVNMLNMIVGSCVELLDNLNAVQHDSKLKIETAEISEQEKLSRLKQLEDLYQESKKTINDLRSDIFNIKCNTNSQLRELTSVINIQKQALCRYQKELIAKDTEILNLRKKNLQLTQQLAEKDSAIERCVEMQAGPSTGTIKYRQPGSSSKHKLAVNVSAPDVPSSAASAKVLQRRADELQKVRAVFLYFTNTACLPHHNLTQCYPYVVLHKTLCMFMNNFLESFLLL